MRKPRSKSKVEEYGKMAVHALKEHAHCVRMMHGVDPQVNRQWYEAALNEEAAAVGAASMAAWYWLQEQEQEASDGAGTGQA